MSFDALEISDQDGKPIELYEFTQGWDGLGNGRRWLYTTADRAIAFSYDPDYPDDVYQPEAISNGGIIIAGGSEEQEATISMPLANAVAQLFNGTPPSIDINVTIRRIHYEDNEAPIYWMGFVSSRKIPQQGQADLYCNTLIATFSRSGLRLAYTRQCPHPLYAPTTCKAVMNPVDVTIAAMTGNSITSDDLSAVSDGLFAGGLIRWLVAPGTYETRAIDSHASDTIVLLGATDGLEVGQTITAFIGCPHTRVGCRNLHNNLTNYGGYAHMPGKSPFDGDPVF